MAKKQTRVNPAVLKNLVDFMNNPPGGGDMLRSNYDPDHDNAVETADDADKLDGLHASAFAGASHEHAATAITSGSFDGDRLPALSATKKGGAPATGTPSGKYLKDDGTWATPPGGGGTPTGTGFRKVVAGVEDAAAKLVENAEVHASAAIVESKLALNYATHSPANDPTADQKAALPGTSGTPSASNKYVTNDDSRNTDARTPTAHATSHKSGGGDAVKLDELAAPTDVATLNADTSKHGLLPKLGGGTTNFLREDGTWAATPGGSTIGYVMNMMALLLAAPADSVNYYFGGTCVAPDTTPGQKRCYIAKAGTIKVAYIFSHAGTPGSNNAISVYIRKNNTTSTLIATLSTATAVRLFSNAALSIAVAEGDYFEIEVVCPVWTTNPLNWKLGGTVYIE